MALMFVIQQGFLSDVILFDSIFEAHEEADRWGGACCPDVIRFEIVGLD
jgi:hypothetical protein